MSYRDTDVELLPLSEACVFYHYFSTGLCRFRATGPIADTRERVGADTGDQVYQGLISVLFGSLGSVSLGGLVLFV